jgi:hypothetical protein
MTDDRLHETEVTARGSRDYVARVRALLDLAEKAGSEHEAEIARNKAMELMFRHGISDAMVGVASATPDEIRQVTFKYTGILKDAKRSIAVGVSRGLGNKLVVGDNEYARPKYSYTTVTGWNSDLERLEVMLASIQIQADHALKQWEREQKRSRSGWSELSAWQKFQDRRQFLISFGSGVEHKLLIALRSAMAEAAKERAEANAESVAEATTGVELALRDRRESVKDWYDRHYGNGLRTVHSRLSAGSYGASSAGHAAGRAADVGQHRVGHGRRAIGPSN